MFRPMTNVVTGSGWNFRIIWSAAAPIFSISSDANNAKPSSSVRRSPRSALSNIASMLIAALSSLFLAFYHINILEIRPRRKKRPLAARHVMDERLTGRYLSIYGFNPVTPTLQPQPHRTLVQDPRSNHPHARYLPTDGANDHLHRPHPGFPSGYPHASVPPGTSSAIPRRRGSPRTRSTGYAEESARLTGHRSSGRRKSPYCRRTDALECHIPDAMEDLGNTPLKQAGVPTGTSTVRERSADAAPSAAPASSNPALTAKSPAVPTQPPWSSAGSRSSPTAPCPS